MGATNCVFSFSDDIFNFNSSILVFFSNFYLISFNTIKYDDLLFVIICYPGCGFSPSEGSAYLSSCLFYNVFHRRGILPLCVVVFYCYCELLTFLKHFSVGIRDSRKDLCLLWQLPEGMLTWTCFRSNSGWRLLRPTRDVSLCQPWRGGQDEAVDSQRGFYSPKNGSLRQAGFPWLPLLVGSCFFFTLTQDIALGVPVTHTGGSVS